MVPPAPVLTNQNSGVSRCVAVFPALLLALCLVGLGGCAPPGPRAVLQGKRALEAGRFPEAVAELEKATALLPKNALIWNYLGLAYHGNQQPELAFKAYRTAQALDHKISAVRYNLGCLYLEQNQINAAVDELRSYTLLQPGAVEGWVRLGSALLRARRLDEAERGFRAALELQSRNPEALNGLGLVQMQRRRWQEALNHFNVAAVQTPPFPPAVLNSAVLAHQYLQQRPVALQRYRHYLTLQPRPADANAVESIVRNLEAELNPTPPAARATPPVALAQTEPTPPRTNAAPPAAPAPTTPRVIIPPVQAPAQATPPAQPPATAATSATRSGLAPTPSPKPGVAPAPATNLLAANKRPAPEPARTPPRVTPPKATETPSAKPVELEVAQVPDEFVIKPPQEIGRPVKDPSPSSPAGLSASTPSGVNDPSSARGATTNSPKKGFLTRLNPFAGGSKKEPSGAEPVEKGAAGSGSGASAETGPIRPVPRYNYLSPAAPTPGSRSEAEKDFKRGLRAQKSGHHAQAISDYQAALRNDPAYYDAYYNLGLAALDRGDAPLSLWAYELALALRPDSEEARYNFALALKSGGYWLDAVDELQKILASTPSSSRAHLSLANLYSQQLRQPALARQHYERLLELNPRHPEASKIRYWLANP